MPHQTMDKYVDQALAKGGQEGSVMGVYDDYYGHYAGNVDDKKVTEAAAQPKKGASPSPMKIGGK